MWCAIKRAPWILEIGGFCRHTWFLHWKLVKFHQNQRHTKQWEDVQSFSSFFYSALKCLLHCLLDSLKDISSGCSAICCWSGRTIFPIVIWWRGGIQHFSDPTVHKMLNYYWITSAPNYQVCRILENEGLWHGTIFLFFNKILIIYVQNKRNYKTYGFKLRKKNETNITPFEKSH